MTERDASSALCGDCGLCCKVLFPRVWLDDEEVERQRKLGLSIVEHRGRPAFLLPCPLQKGTRCSIYPDRSRACREWRCDLLEKLDAGELTIADAQRIVGEAVRLFEELEAASPEAVSGPIPGAHLPEDDARYQLLSTAEKRQLHSEALLAVVALDASLRRHFRKRPVPPPEDS